MVGMILNNKGFSFTSVMVAVGLLGGISLAVMQLMKNINQGQSFAQSKADEIELKTSVRLLLDDERHCRLSLAGNGPSGNPTTPVTFNKEDIDEDNEGLDVALYLSNQAGDARGLKKFNGSNNPDGDDKSKYGKLTITSMKLIMNNGTGSNYSESTSHNDVGQLRVITQKKISSSQTRDITMSFDLNVGMRTDSSGETTILSCHKEVVMSNDELACKMANKFFDDTLTPNCRSSIGGINALSARGGGGGSPGKLSCPDGYGIVGLSGRAAAEVDAVSIRCQEINYETLQPFGSILISEELGGSGGSSFTLSCPVGTFAVGVFGRAAARIDRIGLRCSNYDGSSITNTSQVGGGGGSAFSDTCNSNTILREIFVHVGSRVDRMKGLCF